MSCESWNKPQVVRLHLQDFLVTQLVQDLPGRHIAPALRMPLFLDQNHGMGFQGLERPPQYQRLHTLYIQLNEPGLEIEPVKGNGFHVRNMPTFYWLQPGYDLYLDRKSTRLNSSHSQISYAVFCLKKI